MTAASTDDVIDDMLASTRRIAVVGLSDRRWRDSHGVAAALQRRGWEIIPVNPDVDEVLGVPAVDSLADIDGDVDLVDVFRRPEFLPDVAREAVAIGAGGIFVQLGLRSDEARETAREAGIPYVENRCLKVEVLRRDAVAPTD
ncbi:MAG TPA: CoA-binding protein [Nitriliruptoraceae bacterium]|nr:CoA-binding protein [Nitriliruptoraceae bacterium]